MYDFIVVGGGLSGTSFAHFVARAGRNICLLEKNDVLGGCVRSVQPDPASDYFIELGAHTIYRSYATMIEIINNVNKKAKPAGSMIDILPQTRRPYKMWANNAVKSLFSDVNFFKLAIGGLKMGRSKHGRTVEDYYTELFGTQNYKNLIHPATSAVICQDSALVAADLLLKSRPKDKNYPRSFTIRGGLSTIVAASVATPNIDVKLSTDVASISFEDGVYKATTITGANYWGKKLVMAAPANEAAKLLDTIYPEVAAILKKLPMNKSRAVGFCTAKANAQMQEFGYLIARDSDFTAVVSRDVIPDDKRRGATFHFKPSSKPASDLNAIINTYKMQDSSAIYKAEAEFMLPRLSIMHYEWRAALESALAKLDSFHLLGNFFDGLSMEDCLIRGKAEALRGAKG
jgi:protoporphyrinogen oxidase